MKTQLQSAINAAKYLFAAFLVTPVLIAIMSIFGDFLPSPVEAEEDYSEEVEAQQLVYDKIMEDLAISDRKVESLKSLQSKITELVNKAQMENYAVRQTQCSAQLVLAQLKANETTDPAERTRLSESIAKAQACSGF